MVNAGAIVTTALLGGTDPSDRAARLLASFSRFAGRSLTMDESVLASELAKRLGEIEGADVDFVTRDVD